MRGVESGMGAQMPTHFDLAVLIIFAGCFGLAVLAFVAYVAWDVHRDMKEARRMTRAVAGLVVQETQKIRDLMRD